MNFIIGYYIIVHLQAGVSEPETRFPDLISKTIASLDSITNSIATRGKEKERARPGSVRLNILDQATRLLG